MESASARCLLMRGVVRREERMMTKRRARMPRAAMRSARRERGGMEDQ